MKRLILVIFGCTALLSAAVSAQEVVITDFPPGIGGHVGEDFFEPYFPQLQDIADTLAKYPLAMAVITGSADGLFYPENHDALNPGLALGRAHVLRNLLVDRFKVDSSRILVQSTDVKSESDNLRYASIRISRDLVDLEARLDSLENREPVETRVTEVKEVRTEFIENFGLQFSGGYSSSPFGGIPFIAGAISWRRMILLEAMLGQTLWTASFGLDSLNLDTWHRMTGAKVIVYPFDDIPVAAVGGWVRIEEISTNYYEYIQMTEGPVLGIRITPIKYLSASALWNPSKLRDVRRLDALSKNNQFLLSIMAHLPIGGAR